MMIEQQGEGGDGVGGLRKRNCSDMGLRDTCCCSGDNFFLLHR